MLLVEPGLQNGVPYSQLEAFRHSALTSISHGPVIHHDTLWTQRPALR